MNPTMKAHKVIDVLPSVLETDSIYYVKTSSGFDIYITDHTTGNARPLNAQTAKGSFLTMINRESFTVKKGKVVYNSGNGFMLSDRTLASSKKTVGMVLFDTPPGTLGIVQFSGNMQFTDNEWLEATGVNGGISVGPYWLDAVPGRLASTPNTTPDTWSIKLGQGIDATTLFVQLQPSVRL